MSLSSLPSLTDGELQQLGVTLLGQRKRIQMAAAQLTPRPPRMTHIPPAGPTTFYLGDSSPQQKAGSISLGLRDSAPARTRITDYFEPPGGRKPAPAFQQPLESLTTAPQRRGSIADFFTRPAMTPAVAAAGGPASAPRGGGVPPLRGARGTERRQMSEVRGVPFNASGAEPCDTPF